MAKLKLRMVFVGGLALGGFSALWACSSDDSSGGMKSTGGTSGVGGAASTGGAKSTGGTTGSGGGAMKTCGAMNVTPGCATFDASLTAGACKTCHTSATAAGFKTIDFVTDPKGSLVGKPAVYTTYETADGKVAGCPAQPEVLLDPDNFDSSLFVTKVRGSGFKCGKLMPLIGVITASDRDCLLSWACELIQK
ncbi:MAG: hypothetical protein SFV15_00295 [Polyangiaceae bacterium]|nr:hypothetical protein [Polyangiaceae bacterium]